MIPKPERERPAKKVASDRAEAEAWAKANSVKRLPEANAFGYNDLFPMLSGSSKLRGLFGAKVGKRT